jgi:hypothetical protein
MRDRAQPKPHGACFRNRPQASAHWRSPARLLVRRGSSRSGLAALGVMQSPGSTVADDRFDRQDVAELTIELATLRSAGPGSSGRATHEAFDRARGVLGSCMTAWTRTKRQPRGRGAPLPPRRTCCWDGAPCSMLPYACPMPRRRESVRRTGVWPLPSRLRGGSSFAHGQPSDSAYARRRTQSGEQYRSRAGSGIVRLSFTHPNSSTRSEPGIGA